MPLTHILVDFDNKQPAIAELTELSGASQRLWIFTSPHSGKFNADYVQALLAHEGRAQLVHCTRAGNNAVDLHIALHLGRLIADGAAAGAPVGGDDYVVVSADKDFVPVLEFVRSLGYTVRQVKSLREALGATRPATRTKKAAAPVEVATATKAPSRAASKATNTAANKAANKAASKVANSAVNTAANKSANKSANKAVPKPAHKAAARTASARPAASSTPTVKTADLPALIESLRRRPNNRPLSLAALGKWLVAHNLAAAEVETLIARLTAAKVLRVEGKKVIYASEPWPVKG